MWSEERNLLRLFSEDVRIYIYTMLIKYFDGSYPLLLLFSHKVMSDFLQTHELQHARLLCPPLSWRSLLKFMCIESVMLSNQLILNILKINWKPSKYHLYSVQMSPVASGQGPWGHPFLLCHRVCAVQGSWHKAHELHGDSGSQLLLLEA